MGARKKPAITSSQPRREIRRNPHRAKSLFKRPIPATASLQSSPRAAREGTPQLARRRRISSPSLGGDEPAPTRRPEDADAAKPRYHPPANRPCRPGQGPLALQIAELVSTRGTRPVSEASDGRERPVDDSFTERMESLKRACWDAAVQMDRSWTFDRGMLSPDREPATGSQEE